MKELQILRKVSAIVFVKMCLELDFLLSLAYRVVCLILPCWSTRPTQSHGR